MPATTLREELPALGHGDHCCLLFSSAEDQLRATVPFLSLGLERNEQSLFVGDPSAVEAVREGLKDAGVDLENQQKKGRLVLSSDRDYLDNDHWRTEKMLGFLQQAYDGALSEGFSALRAAGDVSWQVGPHREYEDVVYYEALLDLFFIGKRMVGMCQYPKAECPPETLSGILNTHRLAAIDSDLCPNFHYVPPDLLIEKDPEARQTKRMEWMTTQLLRVKRAEDERDEIQRQFLHAQKVEAVGRLAGGIAHDFNNILTGILGLVEFVLENPSADEEVKTDVREIRHAGDRAAALTRQLLAFSNRRALGRRVLNLNDALRNMDKFLRRVIGDEIELQTVLGAGVGNLKIDPGQLEQIIVNSAVNARDAMPDGGTLHLETGEAALSGDFAESHPGLSAGRHVMLTAQDDGSGISPETMERIFEPFFSTKEFGKGTGLGLSTVREIVRQNDGAIVVHSEPGKGATFTIYFPRVEEDIDAPLPEEKRDEPLTGNETILLVDDDDLVRKLMHLAFVERGYTVLDAISAPEALKFCERHKDTIHLMLVDALLPRMNGAEIAKRAKSLRPKLKVLFISGCTGAAVVRDEILENGQAFLEKPFAPDSLLRKARAVLDRR